MSAGQLGHADDTEAPARRFGLVARIIGLGVVSALAVLLLGGLPLLAGGDEAPSSGAAATTSGSSAGAASSSAPAPSSEATAASSALAAGAATTAALARDGALARGFQTAYAWDVRRSGPGPAFAPNAANYLGYRNAAQAVQDDLAKMPFDQLNDTERTALSSISTGWQRFFALNDTIVAGYRATDEAKRRATDRIVAGDAAKTFTQIQADTDALAASLQQRVTAALASAPAAAPAAEAAPAANAPASNTASNTATSTSSSASTVATIVQALGVLAAVLAIGLLTALVARGARTGFDRLGDSLHAMASGDLTRDRSCAAATSSATSRTGSARPSRGCASSSRASRPPRAPSRRQARSSRRAPVARSPAAARSPSDSSRPRARPTTSRRTSRPSPRARRR